MRRALRGVKMSFLDGPRLMPPASPAISAHGHGLCLGARLKLGFGDSMRGCRLRSKRHGEVLLLMRSARDIFKHSPVRAAGPAGRHRPSAARSLPARRLACQYTGERRLMADAALCCNGPKEAPKSACSCHFAAWSRRAARRSVTPC